MDDDSSRELEDKLEAKSPIDIKPCIDLNGVIEEDEMKNIPSWSGAAWQDGSRKSAFQPYRVQNTTTVLTNLQRGNVQTLTPVLEPVDVTLHQRCGQGEVTSDDLDEVSDLDEEDSNGLTPLHWACSYGQLPTAHLLIQRGAVLDKEGFEGETPLQLAAAGGHHDTVRLLLSEGADNSNTALMYAAYGDHPHCVNELLVKGADLTMVNLNDDTAYGIAITKGSKQAQAVFENHIMNVLA